MTAEPLTTTVFSPVEPVLVEQVLAMPLGRAYYDFALYPMFVMDGDDAVRVALKAFAERIYLYWQDALCWRTASSRLSSPDT